MAAEVPIEAVVRVSPDKVQAEAWTLVLEAMAIPHRVTATDAGFAVLVPPPMVATAMAVLDAHDREAAEGPPTETDPPDHGPSLAGVAMALALAGFFLVTGPRAGPDAQGWFRLGSAVAERIVSHHEIWRVVTALSLHADGMHLAGNAVASMVFVSALGRWLGGGVALLTTLLAGILGNLLTAYVYATSHNVVGASTSTFGALGILAGLQLLRRLRAGTIGKWRRAFLGVAAGLGLLAMLGLGERADVLAHASGLGFGILVGVLLGHFVKRPVRGAGQALALLATLVAMAGAWFLAFHNAS